MIILICVSHKRKLAPFFYKSGPFLQGRPFLQSWPWQALFTTQAFFTKQAIFLQGRPFYLQGRVMEGIIL
jgi:hypothetical protein